MQLDKDLDQYASSCLKEVSIRAGYGFGTSDEHSDMTLK